MTRHIQTTLARALTGEPLNPHDPVIPELMAEMHSTVRDPEALRQLGMAAVALLNEHLRAVVLTAKAVIAAKGTDHD